MADFSTGDFEITTGKKGADRYAKVTWPIRYGRYHEIRTPEHLFEFNLNGEVKYIRGLTQRWPHPMEWLKRTDANDWVYYSTGAYNEVLSYLGEYYRPCLPYPSNSLWDYDPFSEPGIENAIRAWSELGRRLEGLLKNGVPGALRAHLSRIKTADSTALCRKAKVLHRIIGSPIPVLPPDARHVDYDLIPVIIADGCLYQCDFCCLKSRGSFESRSPADIRLQIKNLKRFYGDNLPNYNALFLGNHEALAAGREHILMAAEEAYSAFGFDDSYIESPTLFMFGSVDSLLDAGHCMFEALNSLPYDTFINLGLESADAATLRRLKKPLSATKIKAALERLLDVNRAYHKVEITANFLLGEQLADSHHQALLELLHGCLDRFYSKGAVYLSPLAGSGRKRQLQRTFLELKQFSRLPAYIYLIQRL